MVGKWIPGLCASGDPIGYVRGHVTRGEALVAMREYEGEYYDEDWLLPCWHGWLRCVPDSTGEFSTKWVPWHCSGAGAFAVTFIDPNAGKPWHPSWTTAPEAPTAAEGENGQGAQETPTPSA